jgi:glycosyltransferase involved in cell wall biosynthesis
LHSGEPSRALHVVFLNWRDRSNPEGGGSEIYVERVAAGLVARGHRVTIVAARYPGSARREVLASGIRMVRTGNHSTVYAKAAGLLLSGRLGRPDVVVDVQNGMPFLPRLYRRGPVVVLVHHVHREQWSVVFGPVLARLGWWIESWLAPRVNRGLPYVAVSEVTRDELGKLGVQPERVRVVHNGTSEPLSTKVPRSPTPLLIVLSRLVPHKRIEIALQALAKLRTDIPDLRLVVAGRGWWAQQLLDEAQALAVEDAVEFAGFVDEPTKHRLLASSWVSLVPSVKEGWGLAVVEAAIHATPSVAFQGAGGVAESIVDGHTGLLAEQDDVESFIGHVRSLLADQELRERLAGGARQHAAGFTWNAAIEGFEQVLLDAVAPRDSARGAQRVP